MSHLRNPTFAAFHVAKPSQPVGLEDVRNVSNLELRKQGLKWDIIFRFDQAGPSDHGSVVMLETPESVG